MSNTSRRAFDRAGLPVVRGDKRCNLPRRAHRSRRHAKAVVAWEQLQDWSLRDKKTLKRIYALIQSIDRNGYSSIGKPEPFFSAAPF